MRVIAGGFRSCDLLYFDGVTHGFCPFVHFMMHNRSHPVFRLGMNNLTLLPQIDQTLCKLNLKCLARKSGFECRQPRKITAHNFILALLALASQGSVALRRQAQLIGWVGE